MPWDKLEDLPENVSKAIAGLSGEQKEKFLEIVNAMLEEGVEDSVAIPTAIKRAKMKVKKEELSTPVFGEDDPEYLLPEGYIIPEKHLLPNECIIPGGAAAALAEVRGQSLNINVTTPEPTIIPINKKAKQMKTEENSSVYMKPIMRAPDQYFHYLPDGKAVDIKGEVRTVDDITKIYNDTKAYMNSGWPIPIERYHHGLVLGAVTDLELLEENGVYTLYAEMKMKDETIDIQSQMEDDLVWTSPEIWENAPIFLPTETIEDAKYIKALSLVDDPASRNFGPFVSAMDALSFEVINRILPEIHKTYNKEGDKMTVEELEARYKVEKEELSATYTARVAELEAKIQKFETEKKEKEDAEFNAALNASALLPGEKEELSAIIAEPDRGKFLAFAEKLSAKRDMPKDTLQTVVNKIDHITVEENARNLFPVKE
jgi:hypothetical protein